MSSRTLAELESENAQLRQRLADAQISGSLSALASQAGARPEALDDIAARFRKKFPSLEQAPDAAAIKEWLHELKASAHFLFAPINAVHAKADADAQRDQLDPGVNPFKDWDKKGGTFNITKASRLAVENPELAKKYAAEVGFPLK